MEYLICFIVGAYLGWRASEYLAQRVLADIFKEFNIDEAKLRAMAKKNGIDLSQPEAPTEELITEVEVKVEQHHGVLYAFRKSDDKFMGQGANRDELVQRIAEDVRGTLNMIVHEEDGAALIKSVDKSA